ncbi:hypothetical protein F5Y19DRAFT_431355 [Xylariaceae sp. FL1651]|nr:hypothetical protein F5Y19DRAFT_431355 [Xylariaceae sp. FL1651]
MPTILVIDVSPEIVAKVEEVQSAFEDWHGPQRMCLFLNQSALALENQSPSIAQYVPLELDEKEYEEVSWYLEDYVLTGAFEKARAGRAKKILEDYGRRLVRSVNWAGLIREHERDERLVIKVMCDDTRTEHVFWEILEDPDVWKDGGFPVDEVQVQRYLSQGSGHSSDGAETHQVQDEDANPEPSIQEKTLADDSPQEGKPSQDKNLDAPEYPKPIDPELGLKEQDSMAPETGQRIEETNILVISARPRSEEDIPHRLVTRVISLKVFESGDEKIKWKLVRPGTWDAFLDELEAFPLGHFDIVHFDVHGSDDKDVGNSLLFIRPDEQNIGNLLPHPVPATEIASVLARYKVKIVILNACRSAKGSSLDKNIAATIVNAGVHACLAMSHNVISRAVEVFMCALYDAMLIKHLPLAYAVQVARRSLRVYPKRVTGFGEQAETDDWIVPIVYLSHAYKPPTKPAVGGNVSLPPEDFSQMEPYGREADILNIESTLLISKRPLVLVGPAGIGKSILLKELAVWWRITGLVDETCYLQLSDGPKWSLDGLCETIHDEFLKDMPYTDPEAIISYLNNNRVLLVLDSIEAFDISDRSIQRKYHRELPQFLRRLQGSKSLILLASRQSCNFLSDCTVEHRLAGLSTMGGMQMIKQLWNKADFSAISPVSLSNPDDALFLEQIIKLLDGNPAALGIVLVDLLKSGMRPKQYLADLLAGKSIDINSVIIASTRCLKELNSLIESVQPQMYDVLHIETLALFWNIIPEKHIQLFEMIYCRRLGRQFGSNAKERLQGALGLINTFQPGLTDSNPIVQMMQDMVGLPMPTLPAGFEGLELDDLFLSFGVNMEDFLHLNPALPFMVAGYERFMKPLKKLGYLQPAERKWIPTHLRPLDYLSVNPILPLLLRNSMPYALNLFCMGDAVKQSSAYYYAYRVRRWPFGRMYYNSSWDEPRAELAFEFYNFMSSAATFIDMGMTAVKFTLEDLNMIRMLMTVHRGVGIDVSRLRVAHVLWERALALLKRYENLLKAEIRGLRNSTATQPTTEASTSEPFDEEVPRPNLKAADTTARNKLANAQIMLSGVRMYLMNLAGQVILTDHREKSPRQYTLLDLVRRLHRDMMIDIRDETVSTLFDTEYLKQVLNFTLQQCEQAVEPEDLQSMWKRREAFHRLVISHNNKTVGTEDGVLDEYPENQRDWFCLPLEVLSSSAQVRDLMPAMLSIRKAIDEGRLQDARREIDKALKLEMFHNANEDANKATLLRLRGEVAEMEGEMEDAVRLYGEAEKLDKRAARRS